MHRSLLYQYIVAKLTYSLSSTPITTAAWVAIKTSTDAACDACEILNTSNAVLKLSIGTAGNEDASELSYYVLPGKSSPLIPVHIAKGIRLSAKAVGTIDADVGDLYINFFG